MFLNISQKIGTFFKKTVLISDSPKEKEPSKQNAANLFKQTTGAHALVFWVEDTNKQLSPSIMERFIFDDNWCGQTKIGGA